MVVINGQSGIALSVAIQRKIMALHNQVLEGTDYLPPGLPKCYADAWGELYGATILRAQTLLHACGEWQIVQATHLRPEVIFALCPTRTQFVINPCKAFAQFSDVEVKKLRLRYVTSRIAAITHSGLGGGGATAAELAALAKILKIPLERALEKLVALDVLTFDRKYYRHAAQANGAL